MPKSFEKGKSGNPRGRPKGSLSMTALLRKELQKSFTMSSGEKIKKADAVIQAMIAGAAKGDVGLIKLVVERMDGAVKQGLELTGANGMPAFPSVITVNIIDPENADDDS